MLVSEVPPDSYYDALRKDMGARYPEADRHLLDHLVALESLFDVCCVTGMSMGAKKALLCRTELDNVLGDRI
eukprot:10285855-Lingulodinium_polyedra.AAC.1